MMNAVDRLRELLAGTELLVCTVCHDALSVRLAREAGIPLALMGGFGVAAARFALPDTGLITFTDMRDHLREMTGAVPGYPIIADGDTGYGNAMNVRRTVIEYARAGAACVLIEDQLNPKKCGHIDGARVVIPRDEARMKIRAAVEAAREANILVLARTDARGAHGIEEALARCRDFQEEGADIIFAEALQSEDELRAFAGSIDRPTLANMMPKTPLVPRAGLAAMGFRIVTYNVMLLAAIRAMQDMLQAVAADDMDRAPELAPFDEFMRIVGLPEYNALEVRYALDD